MAPDAAAAAPPPAPAPDPALVLFARGVIARLELWPALRVAVEQAWGGPSSREKRRWLASEIVDAFDAFDTRTRTRRSAPASSAAATAPGSSSSSVPVPVPVPDAEYVAMMLAQVLEDEFDASFEDGSVEAVAGDIVALWSASEEVVREWERKAEGARGKKVDVREEVGDEDEDEDEDEWEDEESEDGVGDEAPELTPAAPQVQRPAKPKLVVDEDGFTLVGKGRG